MGTSLSVVIDALDATVQGVVEEIVPSADPLTRTFLVKAALPDTLNLFPGMFGRLMVPTETRTVVTAPADSIVRTGQLETLMIKEDGVWKKVLVKTGRPVGEDRVEVLSGLEGDEVIGF